MPLAFLHSGSYRGPIEMEVRSERYPQCWGASALPSSLACHITCRPKSEAGHWLVAHPAHRWRGNVDEDGNRWPRCSQCGASFAIGEWVGPPAVVFPQERHKGSTGCPISARQVLYSGALQSDRAIAPRLPPSHSTLDGRCLSMRAVLPRHCGSGKVREVKHRRARTIAGNRFPDGPRHRRHSAWTGWLGARSQHSNSLWAPKDPVGRNCVRRGASECQQQASSDSECAPGSYELVGHRFG